MAKACYKHGLFAIPYMMPLWFCARGEGGVGAAAMPLPGFLILYLQEKEEGEAWDAPSLVLWFCTCKKRRRKGVAMPLLCS
jgi:hypothetical protein